MNRRSILKSGISVFSLASGFLPALAEPSMGAVEEPKSADLWYELWHELGDRLQPVKWPFAVCLREPDGVACRTLFQSIRNPFFLSDHPGLTQTSGWVGAWFAKPSKRVVEAESAEDIAAAIRFARRNGIRLIVKGGGHSYKGCSNAANSLLVRTRRMKEITLHDGFVPKHSTAEPVPAVSIGSGALWGEVYRTVTVEGGRYVQGGGCLTVGVAGLVQSGGFGSFSKSYGLAAASLLEAEIVTADGVIRTVNANQDPELLFALKGGGGGTFGIVTRLTLQTYDLPATFGAFLLDIRAASDTSFRALIGQMLAFYAETLFGPHWGEQIRFRPDNTLSISMVFQNLTRTEVESCWAPFFDWVASRDEYRLISSPTVLAVPARSFWDGEFLRTLPGVVSFDNRPGANKYNIYWAGNREEAGQVIHAYRSAWLSADLLDMHQRDQLADGLLAASRHWSISLHTNKGLAGASKDVVSAAAETAINPAAIGAFALAICASEGPPAYPGVEGHEPDYARAKQDANHVSSAMAALQEHVVTSGSYLAESDYFEQDWKSAFWGENYPRLLSTKQAYDPEGIFVAHHTVGQE